jgi:hypothetical protein
MEIACEIGALSLERGGIILDYWGIDPAKPRYWENS